MPIAIHINAGRDRNGNPKRGWIIAGAETLHFPTLKENP